MSLTDWVGGSESGSKTFLDENQLPYLTGMWGDAQDLYKSDRSTVADMTPEMQQYIRQAMGFGNTAAGYGNMSANMAGGFGNTAGGMQDYINGIFGNGGFQAPMQNGVNMDTVRQGINNDVLNDQIDAATSGVYRNLNENQLPGIATSAVGSGNAGSTRRGVAEGIAMRGANETAANIEAGMRGNAYNTAYGVAANQAGANQSAAINTNNINANAANTAMNSAGNLAYQGYGNAYNFGAGGVNMMGQGGNAMQDYMQMLQMAPWQKLGLYQSVIGNPISQSESTSSSSGGILPAVGGTMMGVAGVKNAFGPKT